MSKKILSLVLVAVMLVLAVPMTVFAAIAAGVAPEYAELRPNGAYVGWAGCGWWAGNAPAHRPLSGVENTDNGSWAGDSTAQLWNSNHWHRGVNYPGNWEFGVRPADDPNAWYPMDTNVCRVNYEITASAALTSSNNPNGAGLPGYAASGQDLPMVYTHYGWEMIKPSTDWNVSLRYTVDQAGTLCFNSDWMVNVGTASGYDNLAGSGAEGAIAILVNGEYREMPWINAATEGALDRSGVTWDYNDVSTWVNIKDVARAGKTVFSNYYIDVMPGDTIELVVKKVGTTTGYVLVDYNLHLNYASTKPATGIASHMGASVWADANEWGDWMRYKWSSGGNYVVINPGQNSQYNAGPYTTLADYAKYLKIPHTLYSNNWSVGTITDTYGYSAAQHFVAIGGWYIIDNGDGTYTEGSRGYPQGSYYMMASDAYLDWVDEYLDFDEQTVNNGIAWLPSTSEGMTYSYAGEIWGTEGGLTYWDKNNQTFYKNKITTNNNGAYAYSYLSDYAGYASIQLKDFQINPEVSGVQTNLAIAVNNEIVWPAGATLNDKSNWLNVTTMSLAEINKALEAATPAINAGDRVSVCVGYSDMTSWGAAAAGLWTSLVDPAISVLNVGAPTATDYSVGFSNGQYTLNFTVSGVGDKLGAIYNGVEYEAVKQDGVYKVTVPVAAKEMGDEISVTPYAKVGADNVVLGEATAPVSVKAALYTYIDTVVGGDESEEAVATAKTAAALLNYGAAAQAFFGHNEENPANDALNSGDYDDYKDAYGIGNTEVTGTYTDTSNVISIGNATVTYNSITLIAGNEVSIRVIFNGDLDGYTLMTNNGNFAINAVGNGTSTAVIPVSVANWDADYTMYVTDGSAQVSDIVTYGVSTYYARMQGVDANLDVLLNAMMALYETVGA